MNNNKINILNNIIQNHNQFADTSNLYDEIVRVMGCSLSRAKELAATHCNIVSLWAILCTEGKYLKSYGDFFVYLLIKGYCNKSGYSIVDKSTILTSINYFSYLTKFKELEDIYNPFRLDKNRFYQIKIKGNTSGFHFMSGYIEENNFKISDTSYRGIGVNAVDHINNKNFCWIMEI